MAAHRYWRAIGIDPCDGGASIDLSEFWLLAGTTRVDAGAALSSSAAPLTGALADLKDDNTATVATLARGTVLQWDFGGTTQDVTDIRLGAATSAKKFPLNVVLQWSDDAATWIDGPKFFGVLWPGPNARTESNPVGTNYFSKFRLYITANNVDAYTAIQEMEIRNAVGGSNLTLPTMAAGQSTYFAANSNTGAKAFDLNFTDFTSATWVTDGTALPQWLSIDLGKVSPAIGEIAIWPQNWSGGPARAPKDFVFQGSTDNYSWTDILTVTGATGWVAGTAKTFAIPASSWPARIKTGYPSRSDALSVFSIGSLGATPLPMHVNARLTERARPNYFFSVSAQGRVQGTTKDKGTPNVPVSERVRLYRERDGMLIRDAWSAPGTGVYSFDYVEEWETYTVISYDHNGNFRAVVADGLTLANGGVELIA